MAVENRGIRIAFWLCVIAGLLLPGIVRAQETLVIQQMHISIWPRVRISGAALCLFHGAVGPRYASLW